MDGKVMIVVSVKGHGVVRGMLGETSSVYITEEQYNDLLTVLDGWGVANWIVNRCVEPGIETMIEPKKLRREFER